MKRTHMIAAVLAATSVGVLPAQAAEGGGLGIYPDGLENAMVGALPPPGIHAMVYGGMMRYDTLRGNDGASLLNDFKVDVNVVAPRVVWVTPQTVMDGQLAFHAVMPLLDIDFRANGMSFSRSGLGDMTVGAALGYHPSPSLHYVVGLDIVAPTGKYDRQNPASPGRNHWALQPVLAMTYVQPSGWNADLKLMYDINRRNGDTQTRSGQAVHADYHVGWGMGNGWAVGAGGHVFQQTTRDDGPASAAGKARALGIGPSVRYLNDQGWLFTLKWQKDFQVKNRPEGEQLMAKLVVPF